MSFSALLSTVLLCSAGACTVDSPNVVVPDGGMIVNQPYYADLVMGIGTGDTVMACLDGNGVPSCGVPVTPQMGPCAGNAAVGPEDGQFFQLSPLQRIELAFSCPIREVGGTKASVDFYIFGTVVDGAQPVVEVSNDGSTYVAVNLWAQTAGVYVTNPGFLLESVTPPLPSARFVRISEVIGKGAINIDAIKALPIGTAQ